MNRAPSPGSMLALLTAVIVGAGSFFLLPAMIFHHNHPIYAVRGLGFVHYINWTAMGLWWLLLAAGIIIFIRHWNKQHR